MLKRHIFLTILIFAALLAMSSECLAPPFMPEEDEQDFAPGQLIVKIIPRIKIMGFPSGHVPSEEIEIGSPGVAELNEIFGVTKIEQVFKQLTEGIRPLSPVPAKFENVFILFVPGSTNIKRMAEEYGRHPDVEYAEPNYIYETAVMPNDPLFYQQWHLEKINAQAAWEITRGTREVVICILDTGVDYTHPDLEDNMWINSAEDINNNRRFDNWPSTIEIDGVWGDLDGDDNDGNTFVDDVIGWDFVSVHSSVVASGEDPGPPDNDPMDFQGHGTHCSGIASAVTSNEIGVAGIGWNCSIMAVRAGYKNIAGGGSLSATDIANGLRYAADNGADIISMSFGGPGISALIKNAIDYAYEKGCLLIAAAGNANSSDYHYPAAFDNVMAVAATDSNDKKAWFSSFGQWVDVSAPGVNILSTVIGTEYANKSGTSMSTPLVAGLAGLVKSLNPSWTNDEIRNVLISGTDNIDAANPSYVGMLGSGRINAAKTLQSPLMPYAKITSPKTEPYYTSYSGTIEVIGTASGPNFAKYMVEYAELSNPENWTQIGSTGETEVIDGVLATWDSLSINDGEYLIRLTVFTPEESIISNTSPFVLENSFISSPDEGMMINDHDDVQIIGTLRGHSFESYTVEWAAGIDPASGWSISGITLANNGEEERDNELIATWSPQGLGEGAFTLRVLINFTGRQEDKRIHFIKDNMILSGWPFVTDHTVYTSTVVENLYGTGGGPKHVAFATARNYNIFATGGDYTNIPRSVYAVRHDGTTIEGWPRSIPCPHSMWDWSVAVGDVNGDGQKEIVHQDRNYLKVFKPDGTYLPGWPIYLPSYYGQVSLFDIDQDGKLEIFAFGGGNTTPQLYVYDHDGTLRPGWPKSVPDAVAFAIGDIDNDGHPEVVVNSFRNQMVYALKMDGSWVDGFPLYLPNTYQLAAQPLLADFNGDEYLEIVIINMFGDNDGDLYIIRHDGTIREGFPKNVFKWVESRPALGDIDGDGVPEIVAVSFATGPGNAKIFAAKLDGTQVPGFPYNVTASEVLFAPAIADITGDGKQEIIVSSKTYQPSPWKTQARLHIIKNDGTPLTGWPRQLHQRTVYSTSQFSVTAIADLTGDGTLDLIAGHAYYTKKYPLGLYNGGKVIVFNMAASAESRREWPTYHHDNFRTGRYGMEFDPPYVAATDPPDSSTDISLSSAVNIVFSEPIATRTATSPANFKLFGSKSGAHTVTPVYVPGENRVILSSSGTFDLDETLICTVEGGIQDRCGNALRRYASYAPSGNYTFSFSTSDISVLGIVIKDTSSGNTSYTNKRVVTIEALSPAGSIESMMISEDPEFDGVLPVPFLNPCTFEISEGDGLKTVYYKVISDTGKESSTVEASITLDTVAPAVLSTQPTHLEMVETFSPAIWAEFNDLLMSQDAAEPSYFEVFGSISGANITAPQYDNANKVTFNQTNSFEAGETVTCNISGSVRDKAGNKLETAYSWSFTIAPFFISSIRITNALNGMTGRTNSTLVSIEAVGLVGDPDSMMISESPDFSGADWEDFIDPASFTLSSGDGVKTIYYKLKKESYETPPVSSLIILDTEGPLLESTSPADDEENVLTPHDLGLTFNEQVTLEGLIVSTAPYAELGAPALSNGNRTVRFGSVGWTRSTSYIVTLEAAKDLALNDCQNAPFIFSFTTVPDDIEGPDIRVMFDGTNYVENDIISPAPLITARIIDRGEIPQGVDPDTIKIKIEGVGIFDPDSFESDIMTYKVTAPLTPRTYLITIEAADMAMPPNLAAKTCRVRVAAGEARIEGAVLSYPSVFKPLSHNPMENTLKISYTLTSPADINLFLYDIGGRIVMRKKFSPGDPGGKAGVNTVDWNGITDLGGFAGNGIYVLKITSGNRVLGTSKIVIYD